MVRLVFSVLLIGTLTGAQAALHAAQASPRSAAPPRADQAQGGTPASTLDEVRRLRGQNKWASAESLATVALARLESDPAADSLQAAEALFYIGEARWKRLGLPSDTTAMQAALRSLAIRERRLGRDHLDVAASHALVARLHHIQDRSDSAVIHVRVALDIRKAKLAPPDTLLAETWEHLATLQREKRDFRGGLASYESALAALEGAPRSERLRADILGSMAACWYTLDDRERARTLFQDALQLLDRTFGRHEPARWKPLLGLGRIELYDGNPAPALDRFYEALRLARAAYGDESEACLTVLENLNLCLQQLGDSRAAKAIVDEVIPRFEKKYGPTHPRTLSMRLDRGFLNDRLGNDQQAVQEFRDVVSIYEKRSGPPDTNLPNTLRALAFAIRKQGNIAEARALCERGLRIERSSPKPVGYTLISLQYMLISILELTDDTIALDSASVELSRIAKRYGLNSTLDHANVEYWTSRADRKLGRAEGAWTHALESERYSRERLRWNLASLPDRRALQLARQQMSYLDLVIDLARGGTPERLETAWDRLVRTRGQVRAEMARRRAPAEFQSDSALVAAHGHWIAAQRRYAQKMVRAAPRDSAARADLEALRTEAEEAERKYAAALKRHASQLPPPDPGLADVRGRLGPEDALVGCIETEARGDTADVTVFVARATGPVRSVELGRASALHATISPWTEQLAASPGGGAGPASAAEGRCRDLGRRVRALTWDRIAPLLDGAKRVHLVADGPLGALPWNALPEGEEKFFVETGPRIYVLNAERELMREPLKASQLGSLLAVGAPSYGDAAKSSKPAGGFSAASLRSSDPCAPGRPEFAPLPGTATETRAVAKAWNSGGGKAQVLLGSAASEAAFKSQSPHRSVVHLATHGFVVRDTCLVESPAGTRGVGGVSPVVAASTPPPTPPKPAQPPQVSSGWLGRRVWLAFAGANRAHEHQSDENEGLLTAEETVMLDLENTRWVVLSACHSGLAEGWYREGTRGMREAFHLAGARNVIASQWAIEDNATHEWMTALYTARSKGSLAAAEALASASRQVLAERRRTGRSTHPFYWAAFVATGH